MIIPVLDADREYWNKLFYDTDYNSVFYIWTPYEYSQL